MLAVDTPERPIQAVTWREVIVGATARINDINIRNLYRRVKERLDAGGG